MAGALAPEQFAKDENTNVIFDIWDVNQDGRLSIDDITKFTTYEYPGLMETPFGKAMITEFKADDMHEMEKDTFQVYINEYIYTK